MSDVFISYKHEERERVVTIVNALQALAVDVWFDAEIQSGVKYEQKIKAELEQVRAVLVCWSPAARDSDWVRWEAKQAATSRKIVPCVIEACDLPPESALIHTENISDWNGDPDHAGWRKTLEAIGRLLDRPGLANLQAVKSRGSHLDLLAWAQRYPDDKYAEAAFATVARVERERFAAEMNKLETACASAAKELDAVAREKWSAYEASFKAWVLDLRNAGCAARPQIDDFLRDTKGMLVGDVFAKLAQNRDAVSAELERERRELESRKAELAALSARKSVSTRNWRLACAVLALFVPVTGAMSYYAAERMTPSLQLLVNDKTQLAEARRQIESVSAEKSAVEAQRDTLEAEVAKWNSRVDDLTKREAQLNEQLGAAVSQRNQLEAEFAQAKQQIFQLSAKESATREPRKSLMTASIEPATRIDAMDVTKNAAPQIIPRCTLDFNGAAVVDARRCRFGSEKTTEGHSFWFADGPEDTYRYKVVWKTNSQTHAAPGYYQDRKGAVLGQFGLLRAEGRKCYRSETARICAF